MNKVPPSAVSREAPLHARIEAEVRRMMALPAYAQGELLPDELTLANRFGASRGTVRVALSRLVQQGLLERRPGVGTRVRQAASESGIGAWCSFSREMGRKGIRVENFLRSYELAPSTEAAAHALGVRKGTRLWRLDRVRGWDARPVLHSRSWFHPRLALNGSEAFARPLYEALEKSSGVVVESAREEFRAVAAERGMAQRLAVKAGEPLLHRAHTVFDAGGRPVEFAEVHYVSARFALTLEIRREES
jgi:GntR family transcriptional regulator